ncbi:hypothetical protein [Streptomyces sp. NPDC002573]|uniref:hypothetical protein n=1 Tax=Streptomyces sp. NPDC002573 TaxID=3364651 RepID=UPI00367B13E7
MIPYTTTRDTTAGHDPRFGTDHGVGLDRLGAALLLWWGVQAQFEERFGAEEAAHMRASLEEVVQTGFMPWAE